ncbi:hypothetical protein JQ597_02680 [Bradyrhizobium sp. AUGA SZCCT0177]|uniref:hypothetical protein n=1 Tax=Bradyrhizobium sp. AUGA SZCCT0177 TaxID=2807665 RepID=UPI001BA735BA|nr:hypothetical protein [Bradyrhizobium sp. AUGA SZCCT0177]MBR1280939.1 hypothetical protein [Bradyrhizobium sp. AUGA SZCCT0177]
MENPLKRVIVVFLTVTPAMAGWRFDAAKIRQVQIDQCDLGHVQSGWLPLIWVHPVTLCDLDHCVPSDFCKGRLPAARDDPKRNCLVLQVSANPRRFPASSLLFAGLIAVASAPICEQQIGMMGT